MARLRKNINVRPKALMYKHAAQISQLNGPAVTAKKAEKCTEIIYRQRVKDNTIGHELTDWHEAGKLVKRLKTAWDKVSQFRTYE
jgi:hypothetical protein